jgi:hypothetical protein
MQRYHRDGDDHQTSTQYAWEKPDDQHNIIIPDSSARKRE